MSKKYSSFSRSLASAEVRISPQYSEMKSPAIIGWKQRTPQPLPATRKICHGFAPSGHNKPMFKRMDPVKANEAQKWRGNTQ
eukprot:SAG11_NODE_924_length_6525_cov_5.604264_6_plen_82_part_00